MQPDSPPTHLVTVVVGAGPAGLLFVVASRLLWERCGGDGEAWRILLVDKRTSYTRNHRLRIGRRPWLALQEALNDPRFDRFMDQLRHAAFKPAVNTLEDQLQQLAADLGVRKEQRWIGDQDGQTSLTMLRQELLEDGTLHPGDALTIVGADSVHSTVREAVRGTTPSTLHTHEHVVRLRLTGPGLPESLGVLQQVRLSKLVDSLLDYRLNPNGFAEVDVFLTAREHPALTAVGATPKSVVPVDEGLLDQLGAPIFARIVRRLQDGFGSGPVQVEIYSSFRLEHRTIDQVVFSTPGAQGHVFLVGDAALSLPFFRGMAALAACVQALAQTHVALALAVRKGEDLDPIAQRYQAAADAIRSRELAMVDARARLIRLVRETARVSALVPFPIQDFLLSDSEGPLGEWNWSRGAALNLSIAVPTLLIALVAPLLDAHVWAPLGRVLLVTFPLQVLGGAVFFATRLWEPGPDRLVRAIWRTQIGALMVLGPLITAFNSWTLGHPAQPHMLVAWLGLGGLFALGLYVFEGLHHGALSSAQLDED